MENLKAILYFLFYSFASLMNKGVHNSFIISEKVLLKHVNVRNQREQFLDDCS